LIEDVVEKFVLTSEQERAFRIIANHAVTPELEQLMMYVGGMAVLENHKSSKLSWTFINPEMNLTDLLFWHLQELQQLFCMAQLITHFWESLLMVNSIQPCLTVHICGLIPKSCLTINRDSQK